MDRQTCLSYPKRLLSLLTEPRPRGKKLLGVITCALLLYASDLPELPQVNTADFLPAIRTQIEQAVAEAKAHPRDPKAAGDLAMTLHAYQQYDAAARAYSRAHLLNPHDFVWLYLLGAVQMAQGRFDSAVKSLQAALQIRSNDLAAQLRLAESFMAVADWNEAGQLYQRILDNNSDLAQAWYGLARVQAARTDHTAAAKSYAKACDLFPPYGAAHFALASELRKLGRPVEAKKHISEYSKNVTAQPPLEDPLFRPIHDLNHSTMAHLQRGAELERAGELEEAIREHETAFITDPNNVQVHVNLISLYGRTRDFAKARQHFNEAIRLNPGRSDAWYNYGVLLFGDKEYAGAETAYRHALEINPSYAEAHNNLGVIYEQQSRLDDAAAEFRQAIASKPDYPLARFQLGRLLVNQQNYDEAIQHFLRAIEPETDETPTYLYALGATYARADDRQHALEYLRKAQYAAVAHKQQQLAASIDRDLKMLQTKP
jgi:tetratricopeptide (TPR) repeat protein